MQLFILLTAYQYLQPGKSDVWLVEDGDAYRNWVNCYVMSLSLYFVNQNLKTVFK